jgi:hypothetical protein
MEEGGWVCLVVVVVVVVVLWVVIVLFGYGVPLIHNNIKILCS